MSTNPNRLRDINLDDVINYREQGITPQITNGDVTLDPVSVTKLDLTLPFEIDNYQTGCGRTIVDTEADYNVRVTMEGDIIPQQLGIIFQLRQTPNQLRLTWSGQQATGIRDVSFDQIQVTRRDKHDTIEYEGTEYPCWTFQVQSKEQSDNNE